MYNATRESASPIIDIAPGTRLGANDNMQSIMANQPVNLVIQKNITNRFCPLREGRDIK